MRGHVATVSDVVFSRDGDWVLTAGPGAAGVWRSSSGARLFYLRGHTRELRSVAFSPTGDDLVTAGADGTVRSYHCTLCGDLKVLRPLAKARMRQLARANAAASTGR